MAKIANDLGLGTQRGGKMSAGLIQRVLQNSFYCGVFKFRNEFYQGKHEPIITKKLFDQTQETMRKRGRPHREKKHNFVFTGGILKCGTCGCFITAETQKGHIYYRCTKKKTKCEEGYIREENLVEQFKKILIRVSLSDDWAKKMLEKLNKNKQAEAQSSIALVQSLKNQLEKIDQKLDKLLDAKLDDIIEKDEYILKKNQLLDQKITIEEKIKNLENKGNNWLEPMKELIISSQKAKKIAQEGDFFQIRNFLKNVGSNFILKEKLVGFLPQNGWRALTEREPNTNWRALFDKIRTEIRED